MSRRSSFTIIELMLVIGIIGTLSGIVIGAINPSVQLASAKDAARRATLRELRNAIIQYQIDTGTYPDSGTMPTSADSARSICKEGVSSSYCYSLDNLVPDYLATLPVDDSEPADSNTTGYAVYTGTTQPEVVALHLGQGDTVSPTDYAAYWKFDESSGSAISDNSGNGYDGTASNTDVADWSTSDIAPLRGTNIASLTFDASNEVLTLASDFDLVSVWTISTWFKYPQPGSSWKTLVRGSTHPVLVHYTSNHLGVYQNGNGDWRDSGFDMTTLAAGWHHLAAVGQAGTTTFYIDGNYAGVSDRQATSYIRWVGNHSSGQAFGTIDDMKIYNRALTTAEISSLAAGS